MLHNDATPSPAPLTGATRTPPAGRLPRLMSAIGFVLGISYPLLALSTGVRATYQLWLRDDITYYLPPLMSGVAALCYLLAAIGFAYRRRWAWRLSVAMLGFEALMVLLVGSLSLVSPEAIGRTVWRHYGADYGYFPLFQPLLGLAWLFRPETLRAYGIREPVASRQSPVASDAWDVGSGRCSPTSYVPRPTHHE